VQRPQKSARKNRHAKIGTQKLPCVTPKQVGQGHGEMLWYGTDYFQPTKYRSHCPVFVMQSAPWLSTAVWTDYRLAVLFTVLIPLVLLVWSFVKQSEGICQLLIIYWKVASLLAITVYLLIAALPIGFLSGWFARVMIPIALWFWIDINDEIRDLPDSPLKLATTTWRWAVSIYSGLGALFQVQSLRCAFISHEQLKNDAICSLWLQAPWGFREALHGTTKPWFLGTLGLIGLVAYGLVLGYFMFFKLSKRKRSALG
jgi:Protein of unknown function (DUF3177)